MVTKQRVKFLKDRSWVQLQSEVDYILEHAALVSVDSVSMNGFIMPDPVTGKSVEWYVATVIYTVFCEEEKCSCNDD